MVVVSQAPKSVKFHPNHILAIKTEREWEPSLKLLNGRSIPLAPLTARLIDDPFSVHELMQFEIEAEIKKLLNPLEVVFVSQSEKICPGGVCLALTEDGQPKFKDTSHMRPFFVKKYMDLLDPYVLLSE